MVWSRSRANLMAWAFSSLPVLNLTPLWILNVYSLPSGDTVQDSASCGAAWRLCSGRTVSVSYSSARIHQLRLPRAVWGSRLSTFWPQPMKSTLSGPAAEATAGQRAKTVKSAVRQQRRLEIRQKLMWPSSVDAEEALDRVDHVLDVPAGEPRPIGQDQGLLSDPLADGTLAGPEAEPLHVWRVQVDGQLVLGADPDVTLAQIIDQLVPPGHQRDAAHARVEPPGGLPRHRHREVATGQELLVEGGVGPPLVVPVVDVTELDPADRREDLAQPIVVPDQLGVVGLLVVPAAPMIRQELRPVRELVVVGEDHAAFAAAGHRLVSDEAEGPDVADGRVPAAPVGRADALAGVHDDLETVAPGDGLDPAHVAGETVVVHGHDGARPRRDGPLDPRRVEVQRVAVDVDEDRNGAHQDDHVPHGDERPRLRDDFVAGADPGRHHRDVERREARA